MSDKKEASSDKMDTASTTQTASEPEENRSEDLETTSGKPTGEDMEVEDEAKAEGGEEGGEKKKQEKETGGEGEGKEKEKTEPEPDFQILSNPARVLPQQVSLASPSSLNLQTKDTLSRHIGIPLNKTQFRSFTVRVLRPLNKGHLYKHNFSVSYIYIVYSPNAPHFTEYEFAISAKCFELG